MSEQHTHWIENAGEYQTQVFYTDSPVDPDSAHPTEWVIFRVSCGEQVAAGWGATPRRAREEVAAALASLRVTSHKEISMTTEPDSDIIKQAAGIISDVIAPNHQIGDNDAYHTALEALQALLRAGWTLIPPKA